MNKKLLIGIIAAVVIIGAGVTWYLMKGKNSDSNNGTTTTSSLSDACKYNDKDLCKFVNSWKEVNYMTMTGTSTSEGKTISTTFKSIMKSNRSQMVSTVDGKEVSNYITIDNTSYTLDYTDNTWYKHTSTPSDSTVTEEQDFSFDTKADSTTDTTTYTKIGQEACGSLTCLKYQVIEPNMEGKQYILFDTKDYQLRKMITEATDGTISTSEFSYGKFSINEPSPTKETAPSAF